MKFEMIQELGEEKFRRLAGVKRATLDKIVLILRESNRDKKSMG